MPQKLINLQTTDYEHPFDRSALQTLKAVPGLNDIVAFFLKWGHIKWEVVAMCGNDFHVTKAAIPDLFALRGNVGERLDIDKMPELYMEQNYQINAYTTGALGPKEPAYIVLTTGAVDKLTDEELTFVIGHEAGHYKSDHVVYHLLATYLGVLLKSVPNFAAMPISGPLNYWSRMSEFTADRAGLLACQDLTAALRAIMKMAGLPERYYGEASSVDGFMKQAREFSETYCTTEDKLIKLLTIVNADHPWTVVRAAELIKWVDAGEYDKILTKTKPRECPMCHSQVNADYDKCPTCGYKF